MKNGETMLSLSETELLEKAANSKLTSEAETEEFQITGSPFRAVREKDGGWFAAWGNGKMTQEYETMDELLEWIENNYWNFLITVLTMAMDSRDLYKAAQIKKHMEKTKVEMDYQEYMMDETFKK